MGKNKLAKFADMQAYPNVFEYPFHVLENAECPMRGKWNVEVFGNSNPITLELGCGRGEYAVGLAQNCSDRNFIGVDIKGARMWTGATQALNEKLGNVAFLRTEIENIDRIFASGEADTIWLTFSDPQMKRAQKRMTSTYFLKRYRNFLKDGGVINVKTDSNFLFTYTKYVVSENNLPLLCISDDVYAENSGVPAEVTSLQTYYEQQWRGRGIKIKFISFALPHNGELHEPDVEIPLDSYRSYNRQKRSSLETSK